jgi:predicted lipoprotein with Yx(FWY)xxD motif
MTTRTVLSVLIVAGAVLTACGSDDDGASTSATTTPAAAATTAESTSPTTTGAATVMVATDSVLGEYLVDSEGRTLYLFTQDQGTTTACSGGCADNWPPIVSDAPTAGDGIDAAQLATADGIEPNQVTYHDHLLYYFAGDQAAGDTNGVGIPDWYAVDPAGNAIETG